MNGGASPKVDMRDAKSSTGASMSEIWRVSSGGEKKEGKLHSPGICQSAKSKFDTLFGMLQK